MAKAIGKRSTHPTPSKEEKKKASRKIRIKDPKARLTIAEIKASLEKGEKPKRKFKIHSPKDVKSKGLKKFIKKNPKFQPKNGGRKRCWEMVEYEAIDPPIQTIGVKKRRPKAVATSQFKQPGR